MTKQKNTMTALDSRSSFLNGRSQRAGSSGLSSPMAFVLFLSILGIVSESVHGSIVDENPDLQKVILKDFFEAIPVSPKCMKGGGFATTNFKFSFPGPVSSYFHGRHLQFEEDAFLLEMSDPSPDNKNRTWTFRVGKGGNIYSFVGAYGEAIPPQHHDDAPWIDEVWQTVTVDNTQPRTGFTYDIHQAGAYVRDGLQKPFYSPTLAVHCERNICYVASHGTHAHIPTIHSNSIIYFTRYANCGNGAIEVTSLIYNTKYSHVDPNELGGVVNYLVVPWGGVRRSTLQDLILTSKGQDGEDEWKIMKPLPAFRHAAVMKVCDSAGYTIFTQSIKGNKVPNFELPSKDEEDEQDNDDENADGDDDDDDDDNGKGDTDDDSDGDVEDTCAAKNITKKPPSTAEERRKRRQAERRAQRSRKAEKPSGTKREGKLRIVAKTNRPVQQTGRKTRDGDSILKMPLMPTIPVNEGYRGATALSFESSTTGANFKVDAIINWNFNGNGMMFVSKSHDAKELNEIITEGDEFVVSLVNEGKRKEDNLALSFVHGRDEKKKHVGKLGSFCRYGSGGGAHRDFTVLSCIHRDDLPPGQLWYKRQYLVSDALTELGASSRMWNGEVERGIVGQNGIFNLASRIVSICASSDNSVVGAAVGRSMECPDGSHVACRGTTTPNAENDGRMLWAVICGDEAHIGHDMYHFAPPDDDEEKKKHRLHRCHGMDHGEFPSFHLLGFFQKGSCDEVKDAKYDPGFVAKKDSEHDEL